MNNTTEYQTKLDLVRKIIATPNFQNSPIAKQFEYMKNMMLNGVEKEDILVILDRYKPIKIENDKWAAIKAKQDMESNQFIEQYGIKTLSQNEWTQIVAQRSSKIKVLLVCVSFDEFSKRQLCIDIVRYFTPYSVTDDRLGNDIEFFCVNPETYGRPRASNDMFERQTWIDREHYFQLPFGNRIDSREYPDSDRLIQNGPYDFVLYVNCAIYGNTHFLGVGNNLNEEGEQLRSIMAPNSALIIHPFRHIPVQTILALQEVGLNLIGRTESTTSKIGAIGVFMKTD